MKHAALLLALALAAGCGTPCSRIAADREDFLRRTAATDAPHAVVAIPYALADAWIAERLRSPSVRLPLPGAAAKAVSAVELTVAAVTLEPAPPGRVGVRVVVTAAAQGAKGQPPARPLVRMVGRVAIAPSVAKGAREVRLALRGSDLRDLQVTVEPGATRALVDALTKRLPPAARALLPKAELAALAKTAVDAVAKRGLDALRDELVAKDPLLAAFAVRLPDLPLSGATASTTPTALMLAVRTTLPVDRGTDADGLVPRPDALAIRLSGAAAAELANAALAAGALPSRYDAKGKPDPAGQYAIGFGWGDGPRPLHLHAWCTAEPCVHVLVGVTPTARVERAGLHVEADGQVERIEGPALYELASWLGLASRPVHAAATVAANADVRLGGTLLRGRLLDLRIAEDHVDLHAAVILR